MGIFSPYWTKAIDPYSISVARDVWFAECLPPHHCITPAAIRVLDANGVPYNPTAAPGKSGFVDPNLGAAALGKQAPAVNKGARY
jgi:hypothetical protein